MPAFNEEGCVEDAVREALAVLEDLDGEGEVVVVDDGSRDRTPDILASLARHDPRLRVVRHEVNQGIGAFNRRMLAEARGEWVLFTSSDGEFDPREALRFMDIAQREGADAVLGYRGQRNEQYTPSRRAVSYLFNALTLVCFGARFKDIGSIRLLRRELFQPIELYSQSAFLNAERLLVGRRRGARIVQVPTRHRPRLSGRGGGARPRKVAHAVGDLLRTRARWLRFDRYYGRRPSA